MRPVRACLSLVCFAGTTAGNRLQSPTIDWSRYVPTQIAGLGRYNKAPALFLERVRGGDVLPVPIPENQEFASEQLVRSGRAAPVDVRQAIQSVTNRDGGLFDNLPWKWNPSALAKRDAVLALSSFVPRKDLSKEEEKLRLDAELALRRLDLDTGVEEERARIGVEVALRKLFESLDSDRDEGSGSSYRLLLDMIRRDACAEPSAVFIEDSSVFENRLVLGGCLLLERKGSPSTTVLCECFPEEAIGVASALGNAIQVESEVWEAAAVPPKYSMQADKMRLDVAVPRREVADVPTKEVPLPWKIESAEEFESMTFQDKALSALAAGLKLPRPRNIDGEKMNSLLAPLLDESIRRKLEVQKAVDAGDFASASALEKSSSRRYKLIKELRRAVAEEQYQKAAELSFELRVETERRSDITQDEGSYDPNLDQDSWYTEMLIKQRERKLQGMTLETESQRKEREWLADVAERKARIERIRLKEEECSSCSKVFQVDQS